MFGFLFKKKKVVVTARRPGVRNVDFYNPPEEPPLFQLPEKEGIKPWEKRKLDSFNRALEAGRSRYINSISEGGFAAFPAAELTKVMIGVESGIDWSKRWVHAGGSFYAGRMIARVDSPIWAKIPDFGGPYEPFDRTGEYGLSAVSRSECIELGIYVPPTRRSRWE